MCIKGAQAACCFDKRVTTLEFVNLASIIISSNCGQINNEIENTVSIYSCINNELYTDLIETDPDVIQQLANMVGVITELFIEYNEPWVISYEIVVNNAPERKTDWKGLSFQNYPAFNIVQYLALYDDITVAAREFTDSEFDVTRTDYTLFERYLENVPKRGREFLNSSSQGKRKKK